MSLEQWRPIPGFPKYEVSDQGRVRSYQGHHGVVCRILRPKIADTGYMSVTLYDVKNKRKSKTVHRLEMMAFNGPSDLTVNHLNGIKTDNRIENLKYTSVQENIDHAIATGIYSIGIRNGRCVLSEEDVLTIRASDKNRQDLAKEYGVHRNTIAAIQKRTNWRHLL